MNPQETTIDTDAIRKWLHASNRDQAQHWLEAVTHITALLAALVASNERIEALTAEMETFDELKEHHARHHGTTLTEHAEEHVLSAKSNTQPANLVFGVDPASPAGDVSVVAVAHTDNGTLMVDTIITDAELAKMRQSTGLVFHEKMQSLNEMQCMFGSKPPTHHDLLAGDL